MVPIIRWTKKSPTVTGLYLCRASYDSIPKLVWYDEDTDSIFYLATNNIARLRAGTEFAPVAVEPTNKAWAERVRKTHE